MAAKLSSRLGKDKVIVLEPAEVRKLPKKYNEYNNEYPIYSLRSDTITNPCSRSLEAA